MLEAGEVVLAMVPFADPFEIKQRPAVVLFNEMGNIVVVGITSNPQMKGIPLTVAEGAMKNSVIKTNYIFTISEVMIRKRLFKLSKQKRSIIFEDLQNKLLPLKA